MMFSSEVQAVQARGLARIAEQIKLFRDRIWSVPLDRYPTRQGYVQLGELQTNTIGVIIAEAEACFWMKPGVSSVDRISVYTDEAGRVRYHFHTMCWASYWEELLDPDQDPKCLAVVVHKHTSSSFCV